MSLEKAIEENTKALRELTEALQAGVGVSKNEDAAEKPKKETKKDGDKKPAAKKESGKKKDGDYYADTVQPITKKAAAKLGREVVKSILEDFGKDVSTAKDLEPEQWEEYVERLEQELADAEGGEEDDLS